MTGTALYVGRVWHRRWRPRRHQLGYRVFSMHVDLDELPELDRRLALFSHNRFNLFALHDRDFGPGDGSPLRPWVEAQVAAAGLDASGLKIGLLAYPRVLGYAFNPLSIFFCRRVSDGALVAILYEVHNTFRQRHCYLIPAEPGARRQRQSCAKSFYVSPFMAMDGKYEFRVLPPSTAADETRMSVAIRLRDAGGRLLDALFDARRVALSDARLVTLLATHPLMTVKVIAGIHWEALKLWLKGIGLIARPPAPQQLVTIVPTTTETRA